MRRILLLVLLLLAGPAWAANVHVLAGGSGAQNGTDWNNAYDCPNDTQTTARGNTVYLADGNYVSCGATTWSTAVSGTTRITIKHATPADHGSNTGWVDTLGDGTATIRAQVRFSTPYWTLDGVSRTTKTTGHGIQVTNDNTGTTGYTCNQSIDVGNTGGAGGGTQVNDITIQYVEVIGSSNRDDTCNDRAVKLVKSPSNIYLGYNYLHDVGLVLIHGGRPKDSTWEHNYFLRPHSTSANHGESISIQANNGLVIRYNHFEANEGTGTIVVQNGGTTTDLVVYGNVFANGSNSNGAFACASSTTTCTGVQLYNNTLYNQSGLRGPSFDCGSGTTCSGWVAKNNLFVSNPTKATHDLATKENNSYCSTDTNDNGTGVETSCSYAFVSSTDYNLASATTAGTTLASPYDTDPDGISRTADGVWDRGAYEFEAAAPPLGQVISISLYNSDTGAAITGFNPLTAGQEVAVNTLPTNVRFQATVTGTLASVNFVEDADPAVCDSTSPYSSAWDKALGSHTITAQSRGSTGCTGTSGTIISVTFTAVNTTGSPPVGTVDNFTLIRADTDVAVAAHDPIAASATINLTTLGLTTINVRANVSGSPLESVKFVLDGVDPYRCESTAPYAIGGDTAGDYAAWNPGSGSHTISATPYDSDGCTGTAGTATSLTFTLTSGDPPEFPMRLKNLFRKN